MLKINGIKAALSKVKLNLWIKSFLLLLLVSRHGAAQSTKQKTPQAARIFIDSTSYQNFIPIHFYLKQAGYVNLVIEDMAGMRVRNLIAETWFAAGQNITWWDGTNDFGRDEIAAKQGIYNIPSIFVKPGRYKVKGIYRKAIMPRYEFSVYAPGNPPWATSDHVGGLLANHTPPKSAQFIPAALSPTGHAVMLLGSYVTEGTDGLAWLDLDGNKIGGKKWIGDIWTAAPYLTADAGKNGLPGASAFIATAWDDGNKKQNYEVRLYALIANKSDFDVKIIGKYSLGAYVKDEWQFAIGGVAVYDGIAAISIISKNKIIVVDTRTGANAATLFVASPKGLAFDAAGRLLVLSGQRLIRYKSIDDAENGRSPEVLNTTDISEPYAVTTDRDGHIYISDRGLSHNVKVFSAKGVLLREIGLPGAPQAGPYNPLHMNNPAGISIDERQQLWVAEEDNLPKRVSVWSLDGKLIRAFYGPAKYGGGGTIDGADKSRFYYADNAKGAMEFTLDWQKGTSKLKQIYYRPRAGELDIGRSSAPETAIYVNGKQYFTNSYNSSPVGGTNLAFLFADRNGIAVPMVAMGNAAYFPVLKEERFKPYWPPGIDLQAKKIKPVFFIWQDKNANAFVEPNEISFLKSSVLGVTVMPDLSFCIAKLNEQAGSFKPLTITSQGVPLYDITKFEVLANGVLSPASSGGGQLLLNTDGSSVLTLGTKPYTGLAISGLKNGLLKWTYPDLWPGLHASHLAQDLDVPGEVIGTTRLLGGFLQLKDPQFPVLWAINGNHGNVYLFTDDGIFVSTLFKSNKKGVTWRSLKNYTRNMGLDSLTLSEENFWPTITKTNDDLVYMVDGARSAIIRLDGIETIRRLPENMINVTQADLAGAMRQVAHKKAAQKKAATTLTVLLKDTAPIVDGKFNDWNDTTWVTIDRHGSQVVAAALAVSGGQLYLAYRTGNVNLLANSGEVSNAPFKTGGALDLMIGTSEKAEDKRQNPVAGDCRLLITMVNGKPLTLLYKAIVPGTKAADRVPFSSPNSTISFDRVEDVSKQIQFAAKSGNYEVAIPLALLGIKAESGLQIKGDVGILKGTAGQTTSRTYWANKATAIVSDVPSEAMLTPGAWGTFVFKR